MSGCRNLPKPFVAATNHYHQAQPNLRCSRPAEIGAILRCRCTRTLFRSISVIRRAAELFRWVYVRKPHQQEGNMKNAEYNQIVTYLRQAEQSKYSDHDIKARFEAEPAAIYGTGMARWIQISPMPTNCYWKVSPSICRPTAAVWNWVLAADEYRHCCLRPFPIFTSRWSISPRTCWAKLRNTSRRMLTAPKRSCTTSLMQVWTSQHMHLIVLYRFLRSVMRKGWTCMTSSIAASRAG